MLSVLILASLSQVKPGPMDAFRANLVSIEVNMDFVCKYYGSPTPSVIEGLEEFTAGPGPASEPGFIIEGRWEFDGSCEHCVQRITGGKIRDPRGRTGPVQDGEVLTDGDTLAYHYLAPNESVIHVESDDGQMPFPLLGPFRWGGSSRFDRDLEDNTANAVIERKSGLRGGHRTEVEVYKTSNAKYQVRREVAFDPGVGYLPRFYRSIAYRDGDDEHRSTASVTEWYLIDAQPCAMGGFVPTEWYLLSDHIDDFKSKYPDYNDETRLTPSGTSRLIHFKAVEVEDRKGPVRLDEMAGIHTMSAAGGFVETIGDFNPMTLAEVKSRLRNKLERPNRPIAPNIDYAELHEFDHPPHDTPWLAYLLGGITVVALVGGFRSWRRSKTLLLLMGLIVTAGCGHRAISRPVARLTAAFSPTRILYDPLASSLQMSLIVNNVGNQTLQLYEVDAGCACRRIDPAQLPASLRPGDSLKLAVSMSGGKRFQPQNLLFTFQTDQGPLRVCSKRVVGRNLV